MRRPLLTTLAVLVTAGLVAAACAPSDVRLGSAEAGAPRPPAGPVLTDPDEVVDLALDDLAGFWAEHLPRLYDEEFQPLRGGLVPYGPLTALPSCGDIPFTYDDIAGNALYCPAEDLIAWDREVLIPDLHAQYGALTSGIVMAHEYAHAIQARGGVRGTTLTLELQADCFAGAWVDDVRARIPTFSTEGDALDQAIGGFLELRDSVGISARDPEAHGSGFDRVSAFQEGFEQGTEACVDYEDDPPTAVAIPFGSAIDARSGGNMPLDDLIEPLTADLESFFSELFDARGDEWDPVDGLVLFDPSDRVRCGDERLDRDELELAAFYCVPDDTIYLDGADLVPALDEIGDFAFGGELARQYAFAAQAQLGVADGSPEAALHADCLTGVYAAAEFGQEIPDQRLVLSPGDLDEIIIAFLAFGAETDVTAFARTAAFRIGFLDGPDACEQLLD